MSDRSFVSPATRQRVRDLATPVAAGLGRLGLTPNALTVIGFAGTCVAALAAGLQQWVAAGVLVVAFGIFDLFDGALARATGRVSTFGGFLDSTLDRTGESLVLAGAALGLARSGSELGVLAAGLAMTFASGVTYTRAKAESLGLHGEVGIAPRPERLVVLAAGLAAAGLTRDLDWLSAALALVALTSAITIVQRIWHVRAQAR